MSDEAIRATNDDATSCKKYAVDRGYWRDPYIKFICRSTERKAPEINRGYYARVASVRILLKQFLEATKGQCQIINFGAGFDTLFWNLGEEELSIRPVRFIELDFKDVTSRKVRLIRSRKDLVQKISTADGEVQFDDKSIHTDIYHLCACDLRDTGQLEATLMGACGLDPTLPTLCLAECVLVYMPSAQSSNLLAWLSEKLSTIFFVNYEQVRMSDRFGEVMVANLQSRGCTLAGLSHCVSLETQQNRFLSAGWESATAIDMNTVYAQLPQADVQRIERLEMLDETEMLRQLFDHYCLCWAFRDKTASYKLGRINLTGAPPH